MKFRKILPVFLILVLVLGTISGCSSNENVADAVWTNGVIYTADEEDTIVEAVAVKDGVIVFAGAMNDAEAFIGDDTVVTDLEGKMMIPGMTDSHLHTPGTMMAELFQINLNGVLTLEDAMSTISEYIEANPDMEIYYGEGFSIGAFSGMEVAKGPMKERLDEITDKPVIITSYDGHSAWLSSAGFEYAGITKDTVPPAGGTIEKTEAGELWGTIKELAIDLVPAQEFTEEQYIEGYEAFLDMQQAYGYTGMTSMSNGITAAVDLDPFLKMDQEGMLDMYVFCNTVISPNEDAIEQIDAAIEKRSSYESETYKNGSLKFFADGVIEGVTGYLLEPYTEESGMGSDFVSEPLWSKEALEEAFTYGIENDFQLHIHSIGDASTRQTLDALEGAQAANEGKEFRNVITHLQLVAPEDIPRFGELGVIANMQPYWAFKEPYWWEVVDMPLLGSERAEKEYPMQSFIDAGSKLVCSSDHPVTPFNNPFWAIEVGVTRNLNNAEFYEVDDITDMDDPTWLLWKEERVSLENMIKSFTINGAYQNYREASTGSIEVGKSADFAILNQNLFEINPLDIDGTIVLSTIFKGKEVFKYEE